MNIQKDLRMKNKSVPTPNLIAEVVSLCFKIFLAIFIVTNVVWAIIYFKPQGSRVEINQSGSLDTVHDISAN